MKLRCVPCFFVLTALVGGAWMLQSHSSETGLRAGETAEFTGGKTAKTGAASTRVSVSSAEASKGLTKTAAVSVATLDEESTAVLAEQITLRSLAERGGLSLTSRQWTSFAGVTLCYQSIRRAYEAEIAAVKRTARGQYRFEIPLYPRAGDELRAAFYASLRTELGEAVTAEIARKLGERLEDYFGGFGVAAQTLEFVADSVLDERDFVVTRTVVFWNCFHADGGLKTRRETHFLAIEDPSGAEWGSMLARISRVGVKLAGI